MSVAVIAVVLVMSTDVGERLQVAGLLALVGPLTEQERSTVPVKELAGVTVMVEVLPETAPGVTEMLPLLDREKLVLLTGACQKSPQPARKGTAKRKSPAHLKRFIAAPMLGSPLGLVCGPNSFVPIAVVRGPNAVGDLCAGPMHRTHSMELSAERLTPLG